MLLFPFVGTLDMVGICYERIGCVIWLGCLKPCVVFFGDCIFRSSSDATSQGIIALIMLIMLGSSSFIVCLVQFVHFVSTLYCLFLPIPACLVALFDLSSYEFACARWCCMALAAFLFFFPPGPDDERTNVDTHDLSERGGVGE